MAELKQSDEILQSANIIQSVMTIPLNNDAPMMSFSSWELQVIKTALKECDGNISLSAKDWELPARLCIKNLSTSGWTKQVKVYRCKKACGTVGTQYENNRC